MPEPLVHILVFPAYIRLQEGSFPKLSCQATPLLSRERARSQAAVGRCPTFAEPLPLPAQPLSLSRTPSIRPCLLAPISARSRSAPAAARPSQGQSAPQWRGPCRSVMSGADGAPCRYAGRKGLAAALPFAGRGSGSQTEAAAQRHARSRRQS